MGLDEAVNNQWTGLLEWTTGMDYWNGLLEWTTGMTFAASARRQINLGQARV